jgi:hypothetical protein
MTISSCASAVSLPADARLVLSQPLEHVVAAPSYLALREVLLSSALFHPPKA